MAKDQGRPDVDELRRLLRNIETRGKSEVAVRPRATLGKVVAGREAQVPSGCFYLIEEDAARFLEPEDDFPVASDLFFRRGSANKALLEKIDERLGHIAGTAPEKLLFLDIETAGFHGSSLFLVGLLMYEGGRLTVRQLFARDYSEEAAVIEKLGEYYANSEIVVTFNGRAFDLPFIADRAVMHRLPISRPGADIDLLHVARKIWKGVLPDCRLGTLELRICGRRRINDLPSHLIPQAYHDYVQSGDARLMADVIRHNAYDLITMAHILAKLANG
jgi:uncharacterized protein YprB with RNaseH-like and TPR domain